MTHTKVPVLLLETIAQTQQLVDSLLETLEIVFDLTHGACDALTVSPRAFFRTAVDYRHPHDTGQRPATGSRLVFTAIFLRILGALM